MPARRAPEAERDGAGFAAVIAHTTLVRSQLLQRLIVYSVIPQPLLLALVAWGERRVIRQDLAHRPRGNRRSTSDANDLTPVPPELGAAPGETGLRASLIVSLAAPGSAPR